ncbi:efflux RND transporter permease subunit [Marinibacterium profundimaris]|uniref:Acriflavine resistance protein B n=1 Tax=Marinibacterium profundimaris TaxID=1679460 RepID=A0A225NI15_9RHOB|nr:efflux RND transporter permease subunit [Marinibacterium profundimaris]OWU73383.1 acriflavine resistance protein B [Marinibacterium profundimaris]
MLRNLPPAAGGILSYFTRHRTAANLLLAVLLVLGTAAIPNMRTQFFPDVVIDSVSVSVTWEGAGPEDVDGAIVQVLEPSLLAVEGVESSNATSREGAATIVLEFEPGWDMSRAADEVQTAIDAVTTLPEEADDPEVRRGAWAERVTDVVITGPVTPQQLGLYADELVTRLFAVGVTRTTIQGVAAPETIVEVPSVNLIAHDITMEEIATAIAGEVNADPAGDITGANARVRTGVEKRSAEEIQSIVLRSNPDNSALTIGDVATIRVEGTDRERAYFVADDPAVSLRIDRSDTGDSIEVQHVVEQVIEQMQASMPQGVTLELIRTQAEAITERLDILVDNGVMGLGLVVLLLFLFLNARIAFWVAAGIPAAMFAAIALMFIFGITINMISLFGLIITLGIVVDDAIVVGEHADFRARKLGEHPVVAAERAAQKMSMPVFSATLTTTIAFFGLTAIGGRFGDLIQDIPFTVIVVLAASLVECFLILPNHMSHAVAHSAKEHWYDWPNRMVNRGFRWVRDTLFRPLMVWVIRGRYVVLAGAVALLASMVSMFFTGEVQWRFFNAPEQGSITGNFAMAEGATRADTLEMMREMQRATNAVAARYEEEHGVNPLDYVMAEIGGNAGRGLSGADSKDADQLGAISIELIDPDRRPYSSFAFVADLQEEVVNHPKAETVSFRGWRSGPGGDSLDVQFYGAEVQTLKDAAEDLKQAVSRYPEVSAVQDNLAYDKEELILDLTPQGQALGFTIDSLGRALRARLNGIEAATYPDGPRSAAIRVELPEGELTADFLDRTRMRTPSGTYVPLSDIVTVESRSGFSTVRRENGLRLISVTGDVSEDDPARAEEISRALEEEILPKIAEERQVEWRISGLSEQEREFLENARTGLILSLTGIYLTLAWVFASWTRPLVVMAIIPFGLVGTIWGHYIWGVPLSMFTVVGLLGMTGIIINDSIVLVTTIDEYAEDRGLVPSIIDGTSDRLRPVLLTTLTTVLGLAPLLYETSVQAQFLKPTVITLCYGLGFGMALVLLVVPALIAVQADVARPFAALRRVFRAPRPIARAMMATCAMVGAWLVFTVGLTLLSGALPWPLGTGLPALAAMPPLSAALLLFVLGTAVIVLAVGIVAGITARPRAGKV